jgi:hypothetical protein
MQFANSRVRAGMRTIRPERQGNVAFALRLGRLALLLLTLSAHVHRRCVRVDSLASVAC